MYKKFSPRGISEDFEYVILQKILHLTVPNLFQYHFFPRQNLQLPDYLPCTTTYIANCCCIANYNLVSLHDKLYYFGTSDQKYQSLVIPTYLYHWYVIDNTLYIYTQGIFYT